MCHIKIKLLEEENPPREKQPYDILTVSVSSEDGDVYISEQVKRGASLKIQKPLVRKVEGPFNDKGQIVEEMIEGQEYLFKATEHDKSPNSLLNHIWWAEQLDDGEIVDLEYEKGKNPFWDEETKKTKQKGTDKEIVCLKYKAKKADKIRIYAYVVSPLEEVSIQVPIVYFPFYVDRYRMPGLNNNGKNIAEDLAYGRGVVSNRIANLSDHFDSDDQLIVVYEQSDAKIMQEAYINQDRSVLDILSNKSDIWTKKDNEVSIQCNDKAIYSAEDIYNVNFNSKDMSTLQKALVNSMKELYYMPKNYTLIGMCFANQDDFNPGDRIKLMNKKMSDEDLFEEFENSASIFFASEDDLKKNIHNMIRKFKRNEGGIYESDLLTNHIKNHDSTNTYCEELQDYIAEKLKQGNGKISDLIDKEIDFATKDAYRDRRDKGKTTTRINSKGKEIFFLRPQFNSLMDLYEGQRIALNDIWSTEVKISSIEFDNDNYTIRYHVTLWDHFGLNKSDLEKYFNAFPIASSVFASWFILQHIRGYKPFITKMGFDKEFHGKLSEGKHERVRIRELKEAKMKEDHIKILARSLI